jgi:hypothetical protein
VALAGSHGAIHRAGTRDRDAHPAEVVRSPWILVVASVAVSLAVVDGMDGVVGVMWRVTRRSISSAEGAGDLSRVTVMLARRAPRSMRAVAQLGRRAARRRAGVGR